MTRTDLINIYKEAFRATDKIVRNDRKLAFMDATRRYIDPHTVYGHQLAKMKAEAEAAQKKFVAAVAGLSAAEIAAIITEATA